MPIGLEMDGAARTGATTAGNARQIASAVGRDQAAIEAAAGGSLWPRAATRSRRFTIRLSGNGRLSGE